jgi:hypothetical protein
LAVELVRCILEWAAEADKQTSTTLARVSKVVQTWVTPIIYRAVVLRRPYQNYSFLHALQAPNTNFAASVRRLCIQGGMIWRLVFSAIIRSCPRIESLVINVELTEEMFAELDSSICPGPWHVMLLDHPSLDIPLLVPTLLRNITHIYIESLYDGYVESLQLLPHLTHLGFGCGGALESPPYLTWVTRALSSPSLIVLLLHASGGPTEMMVGHTWRELAKIEDGRLLAGPALGENGYVTLVASGGTIWDGAETRYEGWRGLVKAA